MKPIRILIVDDHTLLRSGIKLALQRHEGFEVVGEAGDGLEGIKRAKQLKPDVVLLDLRFPDGDGLEVLDRIVNEHPRVKVAMLSVVNDQAKIAEEDLVIEIPKYTINYEREGGGGGKK